MEVGDEVVDCTHDNDDGDDNFIRTKRCCRKIVDDDDDDAPTIHTMNYSDLSSDDSDDDEQVLKPVKLDWRVKHFRSRTGPRKYAMYHKVCVGCNIPISKTTASVCSRECRECFALTSSGEKSKGDTPPGGVYAENYDTPPKGARCVECGGFLVTAKRARMNGNQQRNDYHGRKRHFKCMSDQQLIENERGAYRYHNNGAEMPADYIKKTKQSSILDYFFM